MKTHNRISKWYDVDDLCGEKPAPMPLGVSDPEYLDLDYDDDAGTWGPMTWRQAIQNWAIMATACMAGVAVAAMLLRAAGLR